MSYRVVGVRFKKAGKIYYFDLADQKLALGDEVIVETIRGLEYGQIAIEPIEVFDGNIITPLRKVLRKATGEDREKLFNIRKKEEQAYKICQQKIEEHGLPMKLIDVEKTFDESKIIFYFVSDGRIDFRELVKDLASIFRTRIELRQIGVRDEAKILGGIGCCGRELCCATWLSDFASVSIRMAKDQSLSLNPNKISGICGRLMCCLKYENDLYEEAKEYYPKIGSQVITPDGEGKVASINIFKKTVTIELKESKMIREYSVDVIAARGTRGDSCANGNIQAGGSQNSGSGERSSKNQKTDAGSHKREQCTPQTTGPCLQAGK